MATKPQLRCYGNSLIAGQGVSNNNFRIPDQLLALLGPSNWDVANQGTGGAQTDGLITSYSTDIAPQYDSNRARNCIFIWEDTNDLVAYHDAARAIADMETLCGMAKADGWQVYVGLMLPREGGLGSYGAIEPDRQTINASRQSRWPLYASRLVSFDSAVLDYGANNNATYYNADKTHMTDAGYTIISQNVYSQLFQSPSHFYWRGSLNA